MSMLRSNAEQMALACESLPSFTALKLLHIKQKITDILSLIGHNGIFDQYTKHDITHIDAMLASLDWLIPDDTKSKMQPVDWLLVVLSIYFHDVGMLVTKDEFEKRYTSDFPSFCEKILFDGDDGRDYKAKVDKMPEDEQQKFLYQEFVRYHHASRIKYWVMGEARQALGFSHQAVDAVGGLLSALDETFKRDLGLICESHHLDDLDDLSKYKTSQPYGVTNGETANLHYCAVLLRTADLLHITRDRTPSLMFRLLNPSDPISQMEWAKQLAVRSVRPQQGKDKDGNISEGAPKDTVEIHALFGEPNGFFGLTHYLTFAEKQLKQSNNWLDIAHQKKGVKFQFPWKHIDSSNIETQGFLSQPFEFSLDQAKILDLLTGHTLYNDTSIVIRELAQNSIDAVRLQSVIDGTNPHSSGIVSITWDSKNRILTIEDNGTGMSQAIIENHLLKVGSSRYQDPSFKKSFPDFFPISRFGIGILSCFMIADSVEITTVFNEDDKARNLTLKSVHGRYLIRLLDKTNPSVSSLGKHGTRIQLSLRASALLDDPTLIAQRWVLVPGCQMTISTDGEAPVKIGFSSPKEALEKYLKSEGHSISKDGRNPKNGAVQVKELRNETLGLEMAVAVEWIDVFKKWEFLSFPKEDYADEDEIIPVKSLNQNKIGVCVEGIRVQFTSPGFNELEIYAIANITGRYAPRTNVARSSLEETGEKGNILKGVYDLYMQHVKEEIYASSEERMFSLTWSVQEANILARPFIGRSNLSSHSLAAKSLATVPLFLVETTLDRKAMSLDELEAYPHFWTVEGSFFEWAESLLREVPSSGSLRGLIAGLKASSLDLPEDLILCFDPWNSSNHAFKGREPKKVRMDRAQRRIDVQWSKNHTNTIWHRVIPESLSKEIVNREGRYRFVRRAFLPSYVASDAITIEGLEGEIGFKADDQLWFIANTLFSALLLKFSVALKTEKSGREREALLSLFEIISQCVALGVPNKIARLIKNSYEEHSGEQSKVIEMDELISVLESTKFSIFDPFVWQRKLKDENDEF